MAISNDWLASLRGNGVDEGCAFVQRVKALKMNATGTVIDMRDLHLDDSVGMAFGEAVCGRQRLRSQTLKHPRNG